MTPDDADLQAALAAFNEQSLARIRYLRKQAALIGVEEHDMAAALSMRPPSPPPPATLSGIPGTARHVKRLTAAEPPRGAALASSVEQLLSPTRSRRSASFGKLGSRHGDFEWMPNLQPRFGSTTRARGIAVWERKAFGRSLTVLDQQQHQPLHASVSQPRLASARSTVHLRRVQSVLGSNAHDARRPEFSHQKVAESLGGALHSLKALAPHLAEFHSRAADEAASAAAFAKPFGSSKSRPSTPVGTPAGVFSPNASFHGIRPRTPLSLAPPRTSPLAEVRDLIARGLL